MNTEGLDTLAPFFGLLALFIIGSCFICACHRRCCPKKSNIKIEGEYVKYGTYFDRAYNEKNVENGSGGHQISSTEINLEIEPSPSLPPRKQKSHDIDTQQENFER